MIRNTRRLLAIGLAGLLLLSTAAATASSVPVFETAGVILGSGLSANVHEFDIVTPGTYGATLSDLSVPTPFESVGLAVLTSTQALGFNPAPGTIEFAADPGKYFVSVFGTPDAGGIGHYGLKVGLVQAPLATPLPPAVVLFAGAMVALVAVGRRHRA